MTDLTVTLPAGLTAGDTATRRVAGMLLPYNTPGATSAGLVSIRPGAVRIPEPLGRVRLTYGHDREAPIGVAAELTDTPDGLTGAFLVARTPLGDQYLAELDPATPIRDGLSVDLTNVELAGSEVVAGDLIAVAAVPIPAYTDARAALAAEHTTPEGNPMPDLEAAAPAPTTPTPAPDLEAAAVEYARPTTPRATATPRGGALAVVAARLTAARMDGNSSLAAALADITPSGNGAGNESAALLTQALGELWSGVGYAPRYLPLVTNGPLTGTKVEGFQWTVPPTVAAYTGNKTAVPSNAATLDYVSQAAERLAGAHDIDRIYRDLGADMALASYWARMAESLAVQIDAKALALIQAAAGTALTTATSAWGAVIQGTLAVGAVGTPTYALVSGDLIEAMALTPASDAPVGASIPLPPIIAGDTLPANTVIVGAKPACRLLTFKPPIRVEAVNIPNGGIDAGLFSYTAGLVENPAAVVAYTVTPPVAARSSK